MRFHPYAELFPLMDEGSLADLAADIREKGLKQPILLLDGMILDGRNRWKACQIAGVDCRTMAYEGDDPLGCVVSLNLHRRQLTASQRAIIGAELEAHLAQEALKQKADKARIRVSRQKRDPIGRLGPETSRIPQISGGSGCGQPANESPASSSHPTLSTEPASSHPTSSGGRIVSTKSGTVTAQASGTPPGAARTPESARLAAQKTADQRPRDPQAETVTLGSTQRVEQEAAGQDPERPCGDATMTKSQPRGAQEFTKRGSSKPSTNNRTSESAKRAAQEIGVNHDYISKAKRLVQDAPELARLVKAGNATLKDAILLSKLPQSQRDELLAAQQDRHALRQALSCQNDNPEKANEGTAMGTHTAGVPFGTPTAGAQAEIGAGGTHLERQWEPNPSLSRLRNVFGEILAEHRHNSPNGLTSLVACMQELLEQIVKVPANCQTGALGLSNEPSSQLGPNENTAGSISSPALRIGTSR